MTPMLANFCHEVLSHLTHTEIGLRVEQLGPAHIVLLSPFSERLREDPSPCSFWSLDAVRLSTWINDPDRWTIIGFDGEAPAAVGAIQRGGPHQNHLAEVSVAVHPEYRRLGWAAKTIRELEKLAVAQDIEILKALIWVENTPSRALFEALNYEHRATLMAEFKSETLGEIDDAVYYKRLTS